VRQVSVVLRRCSASTKHWRDKKGIEKKSMGKLSRLRDMPTREIGYRIRERIRLESERVLGGPSVGTFEENCLGRLRESFSRRFYLSLEDRQPLRSFVQRMFPQWTARAICQAEALCDHRVELLGYGELQLGATINWHRDPVTGAAWPRRFWADYDPVSDLSHGDSKNIHELNRHQHIARLAKAYLLCGDERYAEEAINQIDSWIEQNPEGEGINWQSSLEIGIRALSWLWTIYFLLPSPAFTESFAQRMTQSLVAQMRHVCAYPSVYSSPNTHLIGEAAALFIAGTVLGGIDEAATWRDLGAALLTQEAHRQILDDGAHCELSTCYHCYAADFYLQALVLARRSHFDFPPAVAAGVERMLGFVLHMTRPDGSLPQLGDDDGGRALALHCQDYRSYRDGLAVGAQVFGRPDFKWQGGVFCEEAFWLLGEDGWRSHAALSAVPPQGNGHVFSSAGYLVYRTGWSKDDCHSVFDCGGLGAPTGGHGHADALSLVFFAAGRDLLIDPGTGVYNAKKEWRDYFRSSAAHNTVVVDGRDQSEPAGTFRWESRASTSMLSHQILGDLHCAEGEHTGYTRLAGPVTHKRRLLFCGTGCWLIADELLGTGEHTFDFYYHFAPGIELRLMSAPGAPIEVLARTRPGDAGVTLCFHTAAQAEAELLEGWVSPRYGRREPASVLRLSVKTTPPLLVSTVVVPFEKGRARCAGSAE
jgi:hypothetical protein